MLLSLGFILLVISGGIAVEKAPCKGRACADPHAEPKECPSACQPTCSDRRPPDSRPCTKNCLESGCVCKTGYILDKTGGTCIKENCCPKGGDSCDGDQNATRVACASVCPATCASRSPVRCLACIDQGCECKPNYVRKDKNGPCINLKDCPC